MKDGQGMYLSSRITLSATLKTSMPSVRSRMSCYPAIRQLSSGTRLTYIIETEAKAQRFNVLELERDRITLSTNSATSPTYFLKESILRMLSVSMALCEDYEIDYSGIIPYLVHLLCDTEVFAREKGATNFNRESDIILSGRLVELISQRNCAQRAANELRSGLVAAISALILAKYSAGFDQAAIARELKVKPDIISDAINELVAMGYGTIRSRSGRVEVVRE